jgi:phage terminase large subunit-like protein
LARRKPSSFVGQAEQYARDVAVGVIEAGRLVRASCERHLRDLERSKKQTFGYRFDEERGNLICRFASQMIHVKGKWATSRPGELPLITLEPWQCFFLAVPFGWVRKRDGLRRFREIYAEIPRKNSKSTLGAIIGHYMAWADDENGAEVFCGATSMEQTAPVFRPAWLMVSKNPEFKDHFGLELGATEKNPGPIYCASTNSQFRAIIGKPGDGDSPHCAIIDEYHEHADSTMYDTMKTGMGARTQPMRVVITTAGSDTSGPCYDKHEEAIKVLQGTLENEEMFAIIYGIDEQDNWQDFRVWQKANPNYGVSVFEDYLRGQLRDALQMPSQQNEILTKNLNVWRNAGVGWMNIAAWDRCKDESLTIEDFAGQRCWLGMDLAAKIDIASLALLFEHDGGWALFCRHYLPEDTIELPHNQHYRKWRDAGWLTQTDGARTDQRVIEADIRRFSEMFSVQELAFDQKESNYLIANVQEFASFPCVDVPQSPVHMSEPMKEMEALVVSGKLRHNGDPVLHWMMGNVVKKQGHGGGPVKSYYPTKSREANKIDGVVAAIMALSRAMVAQEEPTYAVTVID